MPDYTTDIVIDGTDSLLYCGAETELDLSRYPKLKTLTIGSLSYENVNVTKFIGMSELESVVIGSSSFSETENGQFYVKNCPKLKSLKIGSSSFFKYNVFEIENVDALEEIEIGSGCFGGSENGQFYLKSCPKLKSLKIGSSSFFKYNVFEIENVDALEEIEIGELNKGSNFYFASLKLESVTVERK